MNTFYQIETPADELRYLKEVAVLDQKLKNKYDRKFLLEHEVQTENEKTFQPITKPLLESVHQQKLINATLQRGEPRKVFVKKTSKSKNRIKKTKAESTERNIDVHAIFTQPNIDKYFGVSIDSNNHLKFLGKDIHITERGIKVLGAHTREINIPSQRIWSMILYKPIPIDPTVKELKIYGSILTKLDFHLFLNQLTVGKRRAATRSNKYKNIISKALELNGSRGAGLMFTKHKPSFYQQKNIEFFPADKRQLLQKLTYLLGEYQSGNTGLRSEIVPIIQYLRSKKALPKKYKNKNFNWIFD